MDRPTTTRCPIYVQIRGDNEAGLIRAFLVMDGEQLRYEMSTLSMNLAEKDPECFEIWKRAVAEINKRVVEYAAGVKIVLQQEVKPQDMD